VVECATNGGGPGLGGAAVEHDAMLTAVTARIKMRTDLSIEKR
jgi:hypothetical protein